MKKTIHPFFKPKFIIHTNRSSFLSSIPNINNINLKFNDFNKFNHIIRKTLKSKKLSIYELQTLKNSYIKGSLFLSLFQKQIKFGKQNNLIINLDSDTYSMPLWTII